VQRPLNGERFQLTRKGVGVVLQEGEVCKKGSKRAPTDIAGIDVAIRTRANKEKVSFLSDRHTKNLKLN